MADEMAPIMMAEENDPLIDQEGEKKDVEQ